MLLTQRGLQDMFVSNLSVHCLVFNVTAEEDSGLRSKAVLHSKTYFMNYFQTPSKHKGTPVSFPGTILFLIDL